MKHLHFHVLPVVTLTSHDLPSINAVYELQEMFLKSTDEALLSANTGLGLLSEELSVKRLEVARSLGASLDWPFSHSFARLISSSLDGDIASYRQRIETIQDSIDISKQKLEKPDGESNRQTVEQSVARYREETRNLCSDLQSVIHAREVIYEKLKQDSLEKEENNKKLNTELVLSYEKDNQAFNEALQQVKYIADKKVLQYLIAVFVIAYVLCRFCN